MPPYIENLVSSMVVFVLVLARVGGMISVAPLWGSRAIPMRIRAMLAVLMALLVTPMYDASLSQADLWPMAIALAKETGLGLAMGATLVIMFSSLQIAGQLIAQASGLSLAESYDPSQDETVPVFSQLLDQLGLAVFMILGGHRQALDALLKTFAWMPPGKAELPDDLLVAMTEVLSQSCAMGVRIAAPVMLAMLISNLVLGLVSRALPQLNMMNMGLGINSILALLVLAATLWAIPWLFEQDPLAIWRQPEATSSADGAGIASGARRTAPKEDERSGVSWRLSSSFGE